MIRFPDLDTLALVLARGILPPAVTRAPADVAFDGPQLLLRPSARLTDESLLLLPQLGVSVVQDDGRPGERVACWHRMVPLQRNDAPLAPETTVLFEVPAAADWPRFVEELGRLGCPAFGFRWNVETEERVFVRVPHPPVYSLLRAGESNGVPQSLRAYVEQAPRVWVQLGWRHPLVKQIEAPVGQLLLLSPPRSWSLLEDAPFESGLDDFILDGAPSWQNGTAPVARTFLSVQPDAARTEMSVPPGRFLLPLALRMVRGAPTDLPELWVLREEAIERFAAFVATSDDAILGRLLVAMLETDEGPRIVLRVRPSRQPPPILMLPAVGYQSYLKLPNLFLPAGHRLQPALRRDVARRLLAPTADAITWLTARPDGSPAVESALLSAFRPLPECVAHVIGQERQIFPAWQPTARFELESFIVSEETGAVVELRRTLAQQPPARPGVFERLRDWLHGLFPGSSPPAPAVVRELEPLPSALPPRDRVADAVHVFLQKKQAHASTAIEVVARGESEPVYRRLEQKFLQLATPSDAVQRQALWPELAGAYQGIGNVADAAVCWMNALWEKDGDTLWRWSWFRAESQAAHWQKTEPAVERVLRQVNPSAEDVRALAAFSVVAVHQEARPALFVRRIPEVRDFLERHEHLLSVRAVWLAWSALGRVAADDVLSLARARDRLLERLFHQGLSVDRDLPSFLRGADQGPNPRSQAIREWLLQLPDRLQPWIERLHARQRWMGPLQAGRAPDAETALQTERWLGKPPPYGYDTEPHFTRAYSDLTAAWGLARLGLAAPAARLIARAREVLDREDVVHRFLLEAYVHRIDEALGSGVGTALPLLADLEMLEAEQRYKIDWLRQQSRILEPHEKIDPYRGDAQTGGADPLRRNRPLASLWGIADRVELAQRLETLLAASAASDPEMPARSRVLAVALELAPRVGERFAVRVLDAVLPMLDELADTLEPAPLLERSLFVAAHFGLAERVQELAVRFEQLMDQRHGADAVAAFESLAQQSFRGLRRLGLRSSIDRLLKQMAGQLLPGRDLANLRRTAGDHLSPAGWRALLHVAAGWFSCGLEEQALLVVDEAAYLLFQCKLPPKEQTALAAAYASALGQAPVRIALERLDELFRQLDRIHTKHSTNSHYSLAVLNVVEAAVLAVASNDFALGNRVRRWLDEDEFLVRRRIHRDLRTLMNEAGIQ
ncbi:MAG: hypothetical protein K2R98_33980 [Gemmataceae bacterium]|nr:hypothetical protein [Gemmataceae bacterium]